MNQDNIIRVYTRLLGLKNNLPKDCFGIKENYVNDYHQIVDILARETEISLDEFMVPDQEMENKMTSCWPDNEFFGQKAGAKYSKDRYCERELFLSKLDALLSYFQIKYLSGDKPQEIGFDIKKE